MQSNIEKKTKNKGGDYIGTSKVIVEIPKEINYHSATTMNLWESMMSLNHLQFQFSCLSLSHAWKLGVCVVVGVVWDETRMQ